jgi:hypothetical protein
MGPVADDLKMDQPVAGASGAYWRSGNPGRETGYSCSKPWIVEDLSQGAVPDPLLHLPDRRRVTECEAELGPYAHGLRRARRGKGGWRLGRQWFFGEHMLAR